MKRGRDRGYLPEPAKYFFISDNHGQEEAAKREFAKEGLVLNFTRGSQNLGEHVHLLLRGFYGDYTHHNDVSHLDGGVADDAKWQHHWWWLAVQLASWYTMPYGVVGRRFTALLVAEWRGFSSGVGTPRGPSYLSTLSLRRLRVSTGPRRSGHG